MAQRGAQQRAALPREGGGLTFFASGLNENGTEAADKRLRVHHGEVSIDNVDGFSLMRLGGR